MRRLLARVGPIALLVGLFGGQALGNELAAERVALLDAHRKQLSELAAWCDKHSLKNYAAATRAWPIVEKPFESALVAPVENPIDPLGGASLLLEGDAAVWRDKLRGLRNAQADALFALARRCAGSGQWTLAFRLIHETFRENPEHAEARRILGFVRSGNGWITPFALKQKNAGRVWDATFGWLPGDQVERYRTGERWYGGKWITADEEAKKRQKFTSGWVVRSEHFEIKTNHSLEAGVQLAARLDLMYGVWRQIFVRYFMTDRELKKLFDSGSPKRFQDIKFKIYYYRTREEYLATLKPIEPNIEITTGYYEADKKTAHFYFADDALLGNWYHEATHQLFSQSRPAMGPGRVQNFWAVEGVACYMESLRAEGQVARLGGAHVMRVYNARQRMQGANGENPFYVPLAELTDLNMKELQARPDITPLYSQMGGLAHFFMHSTDRSRREAFVDYLITIYAAKDGPAALAEAMGETFAELDAAYVQFLEATGAEPFPRQSP